jgi:hypothetical protein
MPTQYERLLHAPAPGLPDPLLARLKRHDPDAERELARRYNRKLTSRTELIAEPLSGQTYTDYPPRLLALLWALAENDEALRSLAARLDLVLPQPLTRAGMDRTLLTQLWELGRDGGALEQLWILEGHLPATRVGADTPECVLGFLCWYEDHAAAWEELLRRYALLDIHRHADEASSYAGAARQFLERFRLRSVPRPWQSVREFAAVVAGKLLQLVRVWDYLTYLSIEHMLVKAVHNHVRDERRARRWEAALWHDQEEAAQAPDLRGTTMSGTVVDEYLRTRLPFEERVIRKAQNGLDLNEVEMDWAARQNLARSGNTQPSPNELQREQAAIAAWLAKYQAPTGRQLSDCFPWYRPSQFGKAARLARLQLVRDEVEQSLRPLLAATREPARELARAVVGAMNELVRRAASGNRMGKRIPTHGPVATFLALEDKTRQLLALLGARPLTRAQSDALGRVREGLTSFVEHFPVLVKLAACRRLTRWLLERLPAHEGQALTEMAAWLDQGQQWLSSFHDRDRQQTSRYAQALASLEQRLDGRPQAALRLLLLWLGSLQAPGLPSSRLVGLDRAWWLTDGDAGLPGGGTASMDDLVALAHTGKWLAVAETAAGLRQSLDRRPDVPGPTSVELRRCLKALALGRWSGQARRDACRRLIAFLQEHLSGRLSALLERCSQRLDTLGEDAAQAADLHAEVAAASASVKGECPPAARAALDLLQLWLEPVFESSFSERALMDLDQLWTLTHDPWYTWPAEVPAAVESLIALAATGNWPQLAEAARHLLRQYPDASMTSRSVAQDFHERLQRLARRRGRKKNASISDLRLKISEGG